MEVVAITTDNAEEFSVFLDEDMQENLDRVFYKGIGAIDDSGNPAGALVYELKDSESEEDTKSRIRIFNTGSNEVEKLLMEEYARAVDEEEVEESFYESGDEPMSHMLNENGFSLEVSEGLDVVITIEDIKSISKLVKNRKFPSHIKPLTDISVLQYRSFVKTCLFKGRRGLLDDLAYLPINWFERDISICSITDDKVDGVLLIKKAPSGMLFALLFTAFGPDYKQNLGLMMAAAAQKIVELYPEDTQVVIRRHNDTVRKLTDKFFSVRKGSEVYSGTRSEG